MKKEIKNNSFVFYSTWLETIEELEEAYPQIANELMKAIMEYGIYGEFDESNPFIKAFMANIGFGIDKAKERYDKCVENGKLGGRKAIEIEKEEAFQKKKELKTWKAVAEFYGITEQTLRNKRKEWELEDVSKKQKNQKNLNDNVNVNVNDNVNLNEKIKPFSLVSKSNFDYLEEGRKIGF